jgi:hypothetical protein
MQKDHQIEELTLNNIRTMEDLASSLISSEMPYRTETVQWPNGQVTILPTIMCNRCNVLDSDTKHVRQMAALPISSPISSHIDHVDAIGLQDGDLCN